MFSLFSTNEQVAVQDVDNCQLTNTPTVTATGVVERCDPMALIVNQCAHLSAGKTIHSSAQLEAHGITMDDRVTPNGRHQGIVGEIRGE